MKSYKTLIFIIVVIVLLAAVCLLFPSDGVPFLGRRLFFPTLKEVLSPEKSVSVDEKMRALEESIKMQAITDSINTARETARQKGLLETDPTVFRPTERGRLFLNDLLQCFL